VRAERRQQEPGRNGIVDYKYQLTSSGCSLNIPVVFSKIPSRGSFFGNQNESTKESALALGIGQQFSQLAPPDGKARLDFIGLRGFGHVKAADALARAMRNRADVDEVFSDDSLDHTNVLHKQFYSTLYKKLSAMLPEFLGWWYETSDDPWVADKGRLSIDLPQALPLINLVKEFRPDVILVPRISCRRG
jgi:hypothetical protein